MARRPAARTFALSSILDERFLRPILFYLHRNEESVSPRCSIAAKYTQPAPNFKHFFSKPHTPQTPPPHPTPPSQTNARPKTNNARTSLYNAITKSRNAPTFL